MDTREQAELVVEGMKIHIKRESLADVNYLLVRELVIKALRARDAAVWEEAATDLGYKLFEHDEVMRTALTAYCMDRAKKAREGGGG